MRDLPWPERFDGAFCVGNSFGYLDDAGNAAFLRAVAAALKRGGRFVLETPMVLEQLLRHLQDRPWWKVGEMYLLVKNDYEHTSSRLEIEYTFMGNGRTEVRRGSHRAYRYAELLDLLRTSGFDDVHVAEPWSRNDATSTFVATRRQRGSISPASPAWSPACLSRSRSWRSRRRGRLPPWPRAACRR